MRKKIKIVGISFGLLVIWFFGYIAGGLRATSFKEAEERDLLALVAASYKAGANDVLLHPSILSPDSVLQSLQFLEANHQLPAGKLTLRYQELVKQFGEPSL